MDAFAKPTDPLIGARLDGRYTITGVLGKGGMGVVYAGVHDVLGRQVAIKVLSAAIAAEQTVVERFLREARIAASLGHGNIVDVSDLGHLPDGRPYLVMPRVTGISFSELLSQYGPQSPARVVELLRGVAAALDLVHAKDLIHRDVKPENLMFVVREDGSETVMLMDFGIAVLISPSAARLTGEGVVCGTPAYLAPESARGDDADHRADVYALATVAFELMTGELPFDAENPLKILPMKAFREPPRLAERCPLTFPEAVETAIARGLARLPEERYETAGAFVQALERAVDPGAVRRASLPTVQQMLPAKKPPRMTQSRELPAGSSDALELDVEAAPPPAAAGRSVVERMETELTPPRAEAPRTAPLAEAEAIEGATAEGVQHVRASAERSRRNLLAGVSASVLLLAGLTYAAVRTAEPSPSPVTRSADRAQSDPRRAGGAALQNAAAPASELPAQAGAAAAAVSVQAPSDTSDISQPAVEKPAVPAPRASSPRARTSREPAPRAADRAAAPPPSPLPADLPPAPASSAPSAEALNKQAGQALLQGHLARAAELYAEATVREPRSAPAWRGLGLTSERLGRTREAIRAYRRALQLAPTGPQADSVRERLSQLE